jgi:DMSO/TMAO reductase YedYZ heme-binding membrane subunit
MSKFIQSGIILPIILLFCGAIVVSVFIHTVNVITRKYPDQSKKILAWLHKNIRAIIYSAGAIWVLFVVLYFESTVSPSLLATLEVIRLFALTALGLLFCVYAPTLMLVYLPGFALNGVAIRARRALGILTTGFATTHGLMEFFVAYHGSFSEILSLPQRYQISLLLSTTAATILVIMAMTSFDAVQQRMGKWWKRLHRLVYVVSLLVLFHAFLVGSDFTGGESRLPGLITLTSFIILLLKIGEGFKKVRQKPWSRERKNLKRCLKIVKKQ